MRSSDGRILTTHAGSLIRPRALAECYARLARGEAVESVEMAALVRQSVHDVVARQTTAGIDIVNNGEQDREMYNTYVRRRMNGLGGSWKRHQRADVLKYPEHAATIAEQYRTSYAAVASPPCALGEVSYGTPDAIEAECAVFAAALVENDKTAADAFMTAPTPGTLATSIRNDHYDTEERYIAALAQAIRTEYEEIVRHGWTLQVDGTELAMDRHYGFQDRPLSAFLVNVEMAIDALNGALTGIAPERVRLHICWGNYEGPHDCDVPLEAIWPIVRQAKVGAFMLTGANPRHQHEIAVIEAAPMRDDQILVTGVIDPMTSFIEHPEVVAMRIERAAQAMGDPRRVIAGTDCGFETGAGIGHVTSDLMWAKLEALRDGAHLASQRLF